MTEYDIIVVGGGPAGSTTARRAVQQGLSVLLLDKETFPRLKPCAGGINEPVEQSLDFSIDEVIHRRMYGQTLFAPSGLRVDCSRPRRAGGMVMRDEFDHLLLQKAEEAGADVRTGVKVTKVESSSEKVQVETEKGAIHTGSYLVGADGVNSVVAKQLGFYDGWKDNTAAVAIELEAEVGEETVTRICGVPYDKEGATIHIYFGPVPYGYVWCFPKRSVLSIGAGCRQDKAQNMRANFMAWFERFKKEHNIQPKILSDSAARLPFLRAAKRTAMGRTILVGDAAGFVNPFDGEGIQMAIKSGIIAGPVLLKAIESNEPNTLKEYEKEWKAQFNETLGVGRKVASLLFKSEKNMETICRLGAEDEVINEIMYRMIASDGSYSAHYKNLVKRILLKHPKAGLSLYL
ncbi:MAG: NAD(P)/FAD-dependent oxidoreductase [Candidatus Thorarchaeota archaeon]